MASARSCGSGSGLPGPGSTAPPSRSATARPAPVRPTRRPRARRPSLAHERQTPFGRDRRTSERLRHCNAELLELLLLGATPETDTFGSSAAGREELALAALGLEQGHLAVGERRCERDARGATARADIDDRALGAAIRSAARSASSRSAGRASATSRIAVRPGVSTTAASQRSRIDPLSRSIGGSPRKDDDEPVRLAALARRLDLGIVLQ